MNWLQNENETIGNMSTKHKLLIENSLMPQTFGDCNQHISG